MRARKGRECGLDEQRWKNSSIYSWSEEEGTTHYTMQRMLMIRMAQRSRGMGTAVHPTPTPPLVQNWHNCPLCTTLPAPWPRPWTLIVNNCLSVRDTADSHCTTNRKFHLILNRLTKERINKNKSVSKADTCYTNNCQIPKTNLILPVAEQICLGEN